MTKADDAIWQKLGHAYGKAGDVPALLDGLASSKAKERAKAIFQLGASICHQGSFYTATAPAVRRLVEIVARPQTKDRDAILRLLADVATLDDHGRFLLDGVKSDALPQLPRTYVAALDAVRKGSPTFATLLEAKEPEVRAAAAFVLAWLDGAAGESLPLLRRALAKEKDAVARAALCLSLAYVARYVAGKAEEAAFAELLADANPVVRTAAAIATTHARAGAAEPKIVKALGDGAKSKALEKTKLPWLGGNLAFFATRTLAALPEKTPAVDEALEKTVAAGGAGASFAANVLVRRRFQANAKRAAPKKERAPKRAPLGYVRRDRAQDSELAATAFEKDALTPSQRSLLDALREHEAAWDGDLKTALEERGLPATHALLARWLDGATTSERSILDRELGDGTVADAIVAAAKARGDARKAAEQTIVKGLAGDDLFDAAWAAIVGIEGEGIPNVALDLAWAAGPSATKALARAVASLQKNGEPKIDSVDTTVSFPMCYVATGVGLAAAALAKKKAPDKLVDEYLQKTYGYWERVRDALSALPIERREKWALHGERDDREQPAEYFLGAWPYWVAVPTKKVTARALAHVAKWKPKDPWGGARDKFAVPHLVAYIDALREAGGDAEALEQALAKLNARKPKP